MTEATADFTIVHSAQVEDAYEGTEVPGEFRSLTEALGAEQVAITLIRIPPHSDFEQGSGHHHEELEELYLVASGTLTMRFGGTVHEVGAGSVARVAAGTVRSHRNESDQPVELWAISRAGTGSDATKIDDFWEPSSEARQLRDSDP